MEYTLRVPELSSNVIQITQDWVIQVYVELMGIGQITLAQVIGYICIISQIGNIFPINWGFPILI